MAKPGRLLLAQSPLAREGVGSLRVMLGAWGVGEIGRITVPSPESLRNFWPSRYIQRKLPYGRR